MLFDEFKVQAFIHSYWQQHYYCEKGLCVDLIDLIDGDTLAGLACEPFVNSRIVKALPNQDDWSCQFGPFQAVDFSALPPSHWTLLVDNVDRHIPAIREIFGKFVFLPAWRIDDIMVSYAESGGGVGPHFDYYDVFLIQISGLRQWRLGQRCDANTSLRDHDTLRLLSTFNDSKTVNVQAGDLLYIPAGLAHWGSAQSDDCITLSVGFRAPSQRELMLSAMEIYANKQSESLRYCDNMQSIDVNQYRINSSAMQQVEKTVGTIDQNEWRRCLHQAFGEWVTECDQDHFDGVPISRDDLVKKLKQYDVLSLSLVPHYRYAFAHDQLYINGATWVVDDAFSQQILDGTVSTSLSDAYIDTLYELIHAGYIILNESGTKSENNRCSN